MHGTSPTPTSSIHTAQSTRAYAWGRVLILLVIVGMTFQFVRVVQLKLAPDPKLAAAVGSPTSNRPELARRGDVLDRRGRVLATSTIGYRLFIDPREVSDVNTIAVDLGMILNRDPAKIDREIIPRRDRRYVVIEHLLQDWEVEAIRSARFRGVGIEPRLVRHYPNGELAAALVGFVGFEHSGLAGTEHLFNNKLDPTPGRLTFLRDVRRRALWIDPEGYQPAQPGDTVHLSIDLVIQEIADRRLQRAVHEYNAGGGRLVVMDTHSGEILAMSDILNPRKGWKEVAEDPMRKVNPALGRNRCVTDPYEPGSTFKPFIWAVATELGRAKLDEVLPTPEAGAHRTSRGRRIRDAFNHGDATWRQVLIKSLNSGMAMVAERMTDKEMREAVTRFGFGSRTRCGLPGESPGILTAPRQWNHYTQTSIAMGHEIAVTPVQMVRAFSVFAREGTLPPIRITAAGIDVRDFQIIHQVLDPDIAMLAREVMRDSMTEGTGRRAQSALYKIFAKSGTAQLPRPNGRGYYEDRYIASFIAGAPFTEPRIVVLCIIDDPDKSKGHFGGAIAGPVVRDVIDETLLYLGVTPDQPGAAEAPLVATR